MAENVSSACIPLSPDLNKTSMELFLELLKFTIPGLIVFATAYLMLKLYLEDHQRLQNNQLRNEAMKISLPIRLQAFERLTLLCDRADITNTLLRVRNAGMTMGGLRAALIMAVRQEFEHNASQQLYVSDTLWKIITIARDETLKIISDAAEGLSPDQPDDEYVARILQILDEQEGLGPLQRAIVAIRTEAGRLF